MYDLLRTWLEHTVDLPHQVRQVMDMFCVGEKVKQVHSAFKISDRDLTYDVRHDHSVEVIVRERQAERGSHDILNVDYSGVLYRLDAIMRASHIALTLQPHTLACLLAVSIERGDRSKPIIRWPCLASASVASPPAYHNRSLVNDALS